MQRTASRLLFRPLARRARGIKSHRILAALLALAMGCGEAGDPDAQRVGEVADLPYLRGRNAIEEGRWDLARAAFAEVLAAQPERSGALRWAGVAWSSGTGQSPARALDYFEQWLAREPGDEEARLQAVQLARFTGDIERANKLAAALGPSYEAHVVRAHLELDTDPETALVRARAALEESDGSAGAHALMALVAERAGDFEPALEHARRAASLAPLDSRNHYRLGLLLRRGGDLEGARQALEDQQLVARLAGEGSLRPPSPIESLRLLRELEPRVDAQALPFQRRLLRDLIATGRREEATATLDALAARGEPDLELASLALELGALTRARDWYRNSCQALEDDTNGFGASLQSVRREACFRLALLALEAGDAAEASAIVETTLAHAPWAARFLRLRARLEQESGRTDEALATLARTLEVAPWRAEDRVSLADLYRRGDDPSSARRVLDAAPEAATILDDYRSSHGLDP